MTNIQIVTGANYGDEGKGLVANHLSTPKTLIIMPSNSCQRAHTVVEGTIRRVFRHFGSGTLRGAATYFAELFYVNPAIFRREYMELIKMGLRPTVYCHWNCRIVTPVDMFANVNIESRRGENSHSSTGCGVWETICRRFTLNRTDKDCMNFNNIVNYYEDRLKDEKGILPEGIGDFLHGKYLKENWMDDLNFFYNHVTIINNKEKEKELYHSYPLILFENGQGLLLDDRYANDTTHNTPADISACIPAQEIVKYFKPTEVKIENFYVSRTYYTRHGKGRIGIGGVDKDKECRREDINSEMFDRTNIPNPNQGTLRYGKIDFVEANLLCHRINGDNLQLKRNGFNSNTNLVVTHTNELENEALYEAAENNFITLWKSNNESTFQGGF